MKSTQDLKDEIKERIKNMSKEDMEKYFPKDTRPKGWLNIDDYLPYMNAMDLFKGGTTYKVKYKDGELGTTLVSDHNMWKYEAIEIGITHWWNE